MKTRYVRHKSEGQSIPLIAVVLVVLFGMVALAVDVGNSYTQAQTVDRAAKSAALEAVNQIKRNNGTRAVVNETILNTLRTSGLDNLPTDISTSGLNGTRDINVTLMNSNWSVICYFKANADQQACGDDDLAKMTYMKVDVKGTSPTYFATLFGVDSLKVAKTIYATNGVCQNGFYPLAVNRSLLDDNSAFLAPDGQYSNDSLPLDPNDPSKHMSVGLKKVFLFNGNSGDFSVLRWSDKQASGNINDLAKMFQGVGNFNTGFQEADWPTSSSPSINPPTPGQADLGYYKNDVIGIGDWIQGSNFTDANLPFSGNVMAELDYHKQNHTLLNFPLYSSIGSYSNGSPRSYYFSGRTASFYLVDFNRTATRLSEVWVTLANSGRPSTECSTLVNPSNPTSKVAMQGNVSFHPRWEKRETAADPVLFLVVLDVTASMSWSVNGIGSVGGAATVSGTSCEGGVILPGGLDNCYGANATVENRRIYIAKDVLRTFVNKLDAAKGSRPYDKMQIVTFSSVGSSSPNAFVSGQLVDGPNPLRTGFTKIWPASGWTSDKATLMTAINDAGKENGDPYITRGRTSSAQGIIGAGNVLNSAPTDRAYKKIVIFLTDGNANITKNGNFNNSPDCPSSEDVNCNSGWFDGIGGTKPRPGQALIDEANSFKTNYIAPGKGGELFVIAFGSNVALRGLQEVASVPANAYPVNDKNELYSRFDDILVKATDNCTPSEAPITNVIQPNEVATSILPLTTQKPGILTFTNKSTGVATAVEVSVGADRKMSYTTPALEPGTYTVSGYIGYQNPTEGVARVFNYVRDGRNGSFNQSLEVEVTTGPGKPSVIDQPLTFDLDPTVQPCIS